MPTIPNLPDEVEAVFREFRTCELTTLGKGGAPVTWPLGAFYQPEKGRFLVTASIGLAQKAFNIRRNGHVSMLFSNPTGCSLMDPPAVLVQGYAEAPDEIITGFTGELREVGLIALGRQPAGELYSSNPLTRYLFDWYYMRLIIYITPRRILWWEHSDFTQAAHELEVSYVA